MIYIELERLLRTVLLRSTYRRRSPKGRLHGYIYIYIKLMFIQKKGFYSIYTCVTLLSVQ